jgi:tRNA-Thr(GGU) m(6)t(6)A37 methyltransferase TsaA
MKDITLRPIGVVRSSRETLDDDDWDREQNFIELDPTQFNSDALAGLSEFSHLEVIFHMNRVDPQKIETGARHPRNNSKWPMVGIFAQRGKDRPNQLGITVCKILDVDSLRIRVEGLDAINGSPVLDIKPWVAEFGPRSATFQPVWITDLMKGYWK